MDVPHLSEQEKALLRVLASLWDENVPQLGDPLKTLADRGIRLEPSEYSRLISMMVEIGAVRSLASVRGMRHAMIVVEPQAAVLARQVEEADRIANEPEDIVEKIKSTAKRNTVFAWAMIVMAVATMVVTFVSQILNIAKTLKWID